MIIWIAHSETSSLLNKEPFFELKVKALYFPSAYALTVNTLL